MGIIVASKELAIYEVIDFIHSSKFVFNMGKQSSKQLLD